MNVSVGEIVSFDIFTFALQIVNTIALVAIIYYVYYLIFKRPKKIKVMEEKIKKMEEEIKDLKG